MIATIPQVTDGPRDGLPLMPRHALQDRPRSTAACSCVWAYRGDTRAALVVLCSDCAREAARQGEELRA